MCRREHRAFYFGSNGISSPHWARTLRQFVAVLESAPTPSLEPYVMRADFSSWIGDVIDDYALGAKVRGLEQRHRTAADAETVRNIVGAIRARYDLVEDDVVDASAVNQ